VNPTAIRRRRRRATKGLRLLKMRYQGTTRGAASTVCGPWRHVSDGPDLHGPIVLT
jgi:hypothetical protein